MSRLVWAERHISQGIDRGVMYPVSGPGKVWNGLSAVREEPKPSSRARYVDGIKIRNGQDSGEFSGVIEAYTYPEEFYTDVLTQKRPSSFGLSYRTLMGDFYKLHLVYNVTISPSSVLYQQRDVDKFSWGFSTKPVLVPFAKPTAHLIVDSSVGYSWMVSDLEEVLYGNEANPPRLPTPQEVWDIVENASLLMVIDHGDGTFTVTGPDSAITMTSATTFEIDWPSVVILDPDTYRISSL